MNATIISTSCYKKQIEALTSLSFVYQLPNFFSDKHLNDYNCKYYNVFYNFTRKLILSKFFSWTVYTALCRKIFTVIKQFPDS